MNSSGYGLGSNWRLQFLDEDGRPLTMESFKWIDFGAISYKEIFQNVKMILTTPLYTVALDRLFGLNAEIVDWPQNQAARATVEILDAIHTWEPRVEVMDIRFESEMLAGQLIPILKLRVRNVIYGTDIPYESTHAFPLPVGAYEEEPSMIVTTRPGKPPRPQPIGRPARPIF